MSIDEALARRAWFAGARWARGGPLSETAITAAFDAWWSSLRLPSDQVPHDAPSWWYGRWSSAVRALHDHRGKRVENPALDTLLLDGGYAPRRRGLDAGKNGAARRTVVTSNGDVYTILAWWDRMQGDGTDGNACFIVRGDHAYSSEALVQAFPLHFPRQALQLAAAGVRLHVARDEENP